MYAERKAKYAELEKDRGSSVIAYITSDRPGLETEIHPEVYDLFTNHLDIIGVQKKISLYLYTCGGSTLTAWSLVNLIRQFCDEFEVIVPSKARSAGTLMCLGANKIIMTKQATIGPIDPSFTTALNPAIPGASNNARFPVHVESVNGFIELCREGAGIKTPEGLTAIAMKLADNVHPLVLGQVHRAKGQIQMLARKLLSNQITDKPKVDAIIKFLCSESGSHDYTLHRRESIAMGLPAEKPSDALYKLIKSIYDDIGSELEFRTKFDPNTFLGVRPTVTYNLKRALIESVTGGSDYFATEGTLGRIAIAGTANTQIQDQRSFDGWRHQNA
jgi:hypothetical protein